MGSNRANKIGEQSLQLSATIIIDIYLVFDLKVQISYQAIIHGKVDYIAFVLHNESIFMNPRDIT